MISLGCPKNLVDSEIMLGLLKKDYEITNEANNADILIVNTCGFIESAQQESIDTILEMAKYKENNCSLLIVTGCMAERYKDKIIDQIPEVDAVVGTGNYKEIANVINSACKGDKAVLYGSLDEIEYLENERVLSTTKGYAYLKISEGCDNHCTYCIIPSLRGKYRSRKIEDIVNEARLLVDGGVKEIILIAQDTTRYGEDIYGKKMLVELVRKISEISGIEWIRLLYCYPEAITDELIEEMASNPKLCKYLDIPIQHISDRILKLMGRRGDSKLIREVLTKIRTTIPDVILRTSLIVGFPGETEDDFEQLESFVKEFKFDWLGVFDYSKEEGTPAAKMKDQITKKIKLKRQKAIMQCQQIIIEEKNKNKLGKVYKTLVQGVSEDGIFYFGRTYEQAPDIDGTNYFVSEEPLEVGQIVDVKILNIDKYDLVGEVAYESSK